MTVRYATAVGQCWRHKKALFGHAEEVDEAD